jgi:hypothetical protein
MFFAMTVSAAYQLEPNLTKALIFGLIETAVFALGLFAIEKATQKFTD